VSWSDPVADPASVSGELPVTRPVFGPAQNYQWFPAIASGGGVVLVVWQHDWYEDGDIFAARIAPGGDVLDPTGIPIATDAGIE
jgi:hypothetical protein